MLLVCGLAVAALVGAGCGAREQERTVAGTEGPYLDIGELKYQVQISRILNPADTEDGEYLSVGIPRDQRPGPGQTWFAVFLRVQNATRAKTLPTARNFEIVDTQENVYRPVPVDTALNLWAYEPMTLAPRDQFPAENSAQFNGPIKGGMVLFKVDLDSLQNRPLEFRIQSPEDPARVAVVDLDV